MGLFSCMHLRIETTCQALDKKFFKKAFGIADLYLFARLLSFKIFNNLDSV